MARVQPDRKWYRLLLRSGRPGDLLPLGVHPVLRSQVMSFITHRAVTIHGRVRVQWPVDVQKQQRLGLMEDDAATGRIIARSAVCRTRASTTSTVCSRWR